MENRLTIGRALWAGPYSPPFDLDGTLYGTTAEGGASDAGTVYSLVP
jgi:uncharacterized repeat protein (TIGR03803 family)